MRWLFVLALLGCSKVTEPLDTPAIDAGADGAIVPKDAGSADDAGDPIDAEPLADATAIADAGATEVATADDSGVVSDGGADDAGVDSVVETYGPYEQNGAETFAPFDIDITSSAGNTFTEHVHLPDS